MHRQLQRVASTSRAKMIVVLWERKVARGRGRMVGEDVEFDVSLLYQPYLRFDFVIDLGVGRICL